MCARACTRVRAFARNKSLQTSTHTPYSSLTCGVGVENMSQVSKRGGGGGGRNYMQAVI